MAASVQGGNVLVVDDDEELLVLLRRRLTSAGYDVAVTSGGDELEALVARARPDVVLLDLQLERGSGLELVDPLRALSVDAPIIVMTSTGTVGTAVEAMRRGAFDFLVKPLDPPEAMLASVQRALEHQRLRRANRELEAELRRARRPEGLVGESTALREVMALVDSVASADVTVLVLGESGTGKELVARAVHDRGRRAVGPFVAVNCAALAESVLESELFGHVRGAFTGATHSRRGLFEEATEGTLFLDEIGELAPGTQAKLLRVLQDGEVRPVGASESRRVNVRLVAATHRELPEMVRAGSFRQDLYYRLDVVAVRLPALRDRLDDLPALVEHLAVKHAARLGRPRPTVTAPLVDALAAHSWPGNVRELENVVQRAVVLSPDGVLRTEALPAALRRFEPKRDGGEPLMPPALQLRAAKDALEQRYLREALRLSGGSVSAAARLAGLDRSNLRKLLARHGLLSAPVDPGADTMQTSQSEQAAGERNGTSRGDDAHSAARTHRR